MGIQLGTAYGKVTLDASGVVTGVTTAEGSLNQLKSAGMALGDVMTSAGQTMTAMFTVPLALVGKQSFDIAMDFDSAMNILKGATKASADEMQRLSDQAKALGADMTLPGTSAADAATAMAELAKAGFDVNETLAASKGVLQLSAAGQIDNAEAAQLAANALNAFNLNASEATRVADLLAAGANATSASVKEMGYALQMSASVFANAGIPIEDLTTAIGLMANSGIQGSDAGTSLKSMLLHLQAPSEKAAGIMKDLGIEIYDANGNMKSMREIIQIVSSSMSGLTQEQRDYAMATIFGSDAVRAANIVMMGGTDAFDAMKTSVTETGAAAKMAGTMMEGLPGAVENIKSSFETAQVAAIEPFKDDIIAISKGVANLFNAFSNLPAPIRKLIVIMLALLALTGPLLMLGGGVIGFAFKVVTLVQALQGLGIVLPSLGAIITGFGSALGSIGTFITATLIPAIIPLLPLLALLAATVFLVWLVWKNWDQLSVTIWQLWIIIKLSFLTGMQVIAEYVKSGIEKAKTYFAELGQKGKSVMQDIQNASGAMGNQIGGKIAQLIVSLLQKWNNFKTQVSNIFRAIGQAFSGIMNSIVSVASSVFNGIANAISNLISYVQQLGQSLMNLDVPDVLTPGSPTPFENGLKGIRKEMEALSRSSIPGLAGAMNGSALANAVSKPMQAAGGNSSNNVIHLSSGLTLRDVDELMNRKINRFANNLAGSLGGA